MALLSVNFTFHTGLKHKRFSNARLSGSWDATGSETRASATEVSFLRQAQRNKTTERPEHSTWIISRERCWRRSDAAIYGGDNVGNGGARLQVNAGQINAVIPAHRFVVLERAS